MLCLFSVSLICALFTYPDTHLELSETNGDVRVSYYLTSIYDHSALEAFSKVVQKLVHSLDLTFYYGT